MGCTSSSEVKKVISHMEQQEKKIQDLIQMNQALQQKIGDMQIHSATEGKGSTETTDLTNMLDARFTKLEKTVEKIHNEFKTKLFEGIAENAEGDQENEVQNRSLSLNFAHEQGEQRAVTPKTYGKDPQWHDLLDESNASRSKMPQAQNQQNPNYPQLNFVKPTYGRMKRSSIQQGIANHNDIHIEMR